MFHKKTLNEPIQLQEVKLQVCIGDVTFSAGHKLLQIRLSAQTQQLLLKTLPRSQLEIFAKF